MERLCGRPGCSEPATVAYGMVPTDLVFWLAPMSLDPDPDGVLCRLHADAMVVPRGWTLDDRRDPDLHLFRPPAPTPVAQRRRRSRAGASPHPAEQLELGVAIAEAVLSGAPDDPGPVGGGTDEAAAAADADRVTVATDGVADDDESVVWTPRFDESDDLDGLLSARSPLLSRAFRTAGGHDR